MKIALQLRADSKYFDNLFVELDQALKESGRIDETEAVRIWGTRIAEDILLNGKLDEVTLSVLDVTKASLAVGKGFPFLLLQAGLFQDFERNNIYVNAEQEMKTFEESNASQEFQIGSIVIKALEKIAGLRQE